MSSQKIKMGAKLLITLLIITNFNINTTFAQSDSIKIKKKVSELLKKHGYNSFQLNINSYNQSGGQTAFSITNNYTYVDPNYCPDSINFICTIIDSVTYTFMISPKFGSWQATFVVLPNQFSPSYNLDGDNLILKDCTGDGIASARKINMGLFSYNNKIFKSMYDAVIFPCTKSMPLCFTASQKNIIFKFGDSFDENKNYIYDSGKVFWLNPKVNNKK